MANADPPDEVNDRETPADGDIDAPDPGASKEQVAEREQQHHRDQKASSEADNPSHRSGPGQHYGADFVRNRGEGMPGFNDRGPVARYGFFEMICHVLTALRLAFQFRVRVANLRQ